MTAVKWAIQMAKPIIPGNGGSDPTTIGAMDMDQMNCTTSPIVATITKHQRIQFIPFARPAAKHAYIARQPIDIQSDGTL